MLAATRCPRFKSSLGWLAPPVGVVRGQPHDKRDQLVRRPAGARRGRRRLRLRPRRPAGNYTIVLQVKIPAKQLSADPRSRRHRTVAQDQLALALGGDLDHVWAVSFIVANIPAEAGDYVGLEAWLRNRTSSEERAQCASVTAALSPSAHDRHQRARRHAVRWAKSNQHDTRWCPGQDR